jgi:hypothetical protein
MVEWSVAPFILNLGTAQKMEKRFTPVPLNLGERSLKPGGCLAIKDKLCAVVKTLSLSLLTTII